ncbi:MAG: four helix bundle protein [Patescibacteria group bacterium]
MAFRFQSWQVYIDARTLKKEVNKILIAYPVEEKYLLVDQTRRAMLSVLLQIAEGSERKTEKDKSVFINRSLTSLFEVVACLDSAFDDGYISQDQHIYFMEKTENIGKQLRGLDKYITNHNKP